MLTYRLGSTLTEGLIQMIIQSNFKLMSTRSVRTLEPNASMAFQLWFDGMAKASTDS